MYDMKFISLAAAGIRNMMYVCHNENWMKTLVNFLLNIITLQLLGIKYRLYQLYIYQTQKLGQDRSAVDLNFMFVCERL